VESRPVAAHDGTPLHVAGCGTGADVLVLSGGPGLVNYLADERLAPAGMRAWFPDPRGVGRSGGGPHTMARAVADLEASRASEPDLGLEWDEGVWRALNDSFLAWIHEPDLFRTLADSPVPMHFVAAGEDIRPSWPLRQLAALVPRGGFDTVLGVPHDFWHTHPATWHDVVTTALSERI
jgi:proline iminopeptidase